MNSFVERTLIQINFFKVFDFNSFKSCNVVNFVLIEEGNNIHRDSSLLARYSSELHGPWIFQNENAQG